jgi:hypothetical protein
LRESQNPARLDSADFLSYINTAGGGYTALLVEAARSVSGQGLRRLQTVGDACRNSGFQVVVIPAQYATWSRFQFLISLLQPHVLYLYGHTNYENRVGIECKDTTIPQVTGVLLRDAIAYAYRPWDSAHGRYYPEYPAAGERVYRLPSGLNWVCHYMSELSLHDTSPLRFVFFDGCFTGRIGATYGDTQGYENPYQIDPYSSGNDMASELGIYVNQWSGASYCGYFEPSDGASAWYSDFVELLLGHMRAGLSLQQALDQIWYTQLYNRGGGSINAEYGPCKNWRYRMPPYSNLRVHGRPNVTYLR